MISFTPSLCLFHNHCADGYIAAAVVQHRYPDCQLVPVSYSDPVESLISKDDSVLMVDFAPKTAEQFDAIMSSCRNFAVIDHHPLTYTRNNLFVSFTESGASLTWNILFSGRNPSILISAVKDYDLWLHSEVVSKPISTAIASYGFAPEKWKEWMTNPEASSLDLASEGIAIMRAEIRRGERLATNHLVYQMFLGFEVPLVNTDLGDLGTLNTLGETLSILNPFAVFWQKSRNGQYLYSFRSNRAFSGWVDVGIIAVILGGGGHKHAAGAITNKAPEVYSVLSGLKADIIRMNLLPLEERRESAQRFQHLGILE